MRGKDCKFSNKEIDEMILMRDQKCSYSYIAHRFNTSRQYVHNLLRYKDSFRPADKPGPKALTLSDLIEVFHKSYTVNYITDCWEWIEPLNNGYGYIGRTSAHRFSWKIFKGEIGDSFVLHKCDNRRCVNPDHLYLGDQGDNMVDKKAMRFYTGELWLIEKLVKVSETSSKRTHPTKIEISKMFKLSYMTLWRIRNSRYWPCKDGVYEFKWNA